MSYIKQIFDKCMLDCNKEEIEQTKTLQQQYFELMKECTERFGYERRAERDEVFDCLDKAIYKLEEKNKFICFENCKKEAVFKYKYDLEVSSKDRKTRSAQRKIQKKIDGEADGFLGLLAQIRQHLIEKSIDKEKVDKILQIILDERFEDWTQFATCPEIALNSLVEIGLKQMTSQLYPEINIKEIISDWIKIPTHNTFCETKILSSVEGIKMGRDAVVKAIWRTMKARFKLIYHEDFDNIEIVENPSFISDWDSRYDIRHPYDNSIRLLERERVSLERHVDGTENFRYEYYPPEELWEFEGLIGYTDKYGYWSFNYGIMEQPELFDSSLQKLSENIRKKTKSFISIGSLWELMNKLEEEDIIEKVSTNTSSYEDYHYDFYFLKEGKTYNDLGKNMINIFIESFSENYNEDFLKFMFSGFLEREIQEAQKYEDMVEDVTISEYENSIEYFLDFFTDYFESTNIISKLFEEDLTLNQEELKKELDNIDEEALDDLIDLINKIKFHNKLEEFVKKGKIIPLSNFLGIKNTQKESKKPKQFLKIINLLKQTQKRKNKSLEKFFENKE